MKISKKTFYICFVLFMILPVFIFIFYGRSPAQEMVIKNTLPLKKIKFAAQQLMENKEIVHIEPLILPNEQIKAYAIVFYLKDSINPTTFKHAVKNYENFYQLSKGIKSGIELYDLLTESEPIDFNSKILDDNFYTLIISASMDYYPERGGNHPGLPFTFKLKSIAAKEFSKINPQAKIIKDKYVYLDVLTHLYYFETNFGDKYVYLPLHKRFKEVSSIKDIKFSNYWHEPSEEDKFVAKKKWIELLKDYQKE